MTSIMQSAPWITPEGALAAAIDFITLGAVLVPLAFAIKLRRLRLDEVARRDGGRR